MKKIMIWAAVALLALFGSKVSAVETVLGSGDVVKISVYGSPDLTTETRVSDAGEVTFPLLGAVKLGGLTTKAAESKIAAQLEAGGFVRKAQVNLLVSLLQSQQISVLGQVNRPGRYPVEGKRSVMDMLALAGGVNTEGSDSISLIRKRNNVVTKENIDVIAMIRGGNFEKDYDLAPNDVIFVERAPRFYIYGEVQRPGSFRLERGMTVMQALSVGGGLTARGTERGIRVKRRNDDGQLQIIETKQDDLLHADDVVFVKESLF